MAKFKTTCVIMLNDHTRKLFKLMNFQEIPEEANYIAFFEDGDSGFLTKIERTTGDGKFNFIFPHMNLISYYDTPFEVEYP